MTSHKIALTLMLGVASSLGVVTAAQAASASTTHALSVLDSDHDGTIDLTEAKSAAEACFAKLDKDHDGTLDTTEMASTSVGKGPFATADTDSDGTLDKAEYLKLVETRFNAADTDGDGTVSVEELSTPAGKALVRLLK